MIQRENTLRPYDWCIFLSAGHGGVNPKGIYTTFPSKFKRFNDCAYFYEGEKNREYCRLIHKKLIERNVHVVPLYHNYKDTERDDRTNLANMYHRTIQKGIYYSEHSNAFNGSARGFCIFTSRGYTKSDGLAKFLIKGYKRKFPNIPIKGDDGEWDRDFDEVANTVMNALLIENLFFDNEEDAAILLNDQYKENYTDLIADFLEAVVAYRSNVELPKNHFFNPLSYKGNYNNLL